MSNSNFFSSFLLGAAALALAIPAGATTITVNATAPANYVSTSFASGLPSTWTGTGTYGTANTSVTNQYQDPLPGGDSDFYAYAEAGGAITANFAGGISGLDLLWGSPDAYNTLSLTDTNGNTVSYSPGSGALSSLTANQSTSEYVLFTADPGTEWTSATFASDANSFEFGQIATLAAPAPEPASVALLGAGLLAVGVGAIRRRKSA